MQRLGYVNECPDGASVAQPAEPVDAPLELGTAVDPAPRPAPATTAPTPLAPAPPPPPDPEAVARVVAAAMSPDEPVVRTAPDHRTGPTITGLDTWLWVEGLQRLVVTVAAGPITVTVSATPATTRWQFVDSIEECGSLGVAYRPDRDAACSHVFTHVTPPHGRAASVEVLWPVRWNGSNGASGMLPPLRSVSTFRIVVQQIQVTTT